MAEPDHITLLCTATLNGNLGRFARLGTLLQRERWAAAGPVFVLDLGGSGAEEAWVCRATEGRAPFVVLDAMGYDLAVTGGPGGSVLSSASVVQLRETVTMTLLPWHASARLAHGGAAFDVIAGDSVADEGPVRSVRLDRRVHGQPASGDVLSVIGDVPQDLLLRVVVSWPEWRVKVVDWLGSAAAPPDPVVGATIEFVVSEARAYARRQGGDT